MRSIRIVGVAFAAGLILARAAAGQVVCGDCDASGDASAAEIAQATRAALGETGTCASADANRDGTVSVEDMVLLVANPSADCAASISPTPSPTATPEPTVPGDQSPPTDALLLRQWLLQGSYLTWHAESRVHRSGGPHGGQVRTYLNDIAFDSLLAGNAQHPKGAAVVKELYYGQATPQEWAVETKLDNDSAAGQNWYWYEGVGLAGRGLGICTGCHGRDFFGFKAKDFILTPFPLQ